MVGDGERTVTRVVTTSPTTPRPDVVEEAAALIRAGEVVAIPTETVYGLAANATDTAAVARIYEAKGRPAWNPLIVHLADTEGLDDVARDIPDLARTLAARFWPGPLTLVLRRTPAIPDIVTGGRDTVGVRVPAHPVARAIIRAAGRPIAAPSANRFMEVSPTLAAHVIAGLDGRIPLIVDAGPTSVGIESTVLDLTTTPPTLLRPGGVTRDELLPFTGPLADPAPVASDDEVRASPGMVERHYAPRAQLTLFSSALRDAVMNECTEAQARGERVAVVARTFDVPGAPHVRMPADPSGYAGRLYEMLHELDTNAITQAWIELPPVDAAWEGVRDRLTRAATR